MLLAASIAILIKNWVREFDRGLQALSIPEHRAKTREFRYLGMERWRLADMVAVLPFLIQISLVLFAGGLAVFLFHINTVSFRVTTAIFGVGVLYYAITTTISVFVTSSPFHSPLSRVLGKMYQHVHAYFCPGLDYFLSPNMDTTPVTPFGRLRRRIQISLQKSRPYLEKEFETPINAATLDEFQLSTTTSALQRILDSVPKSQHSELIHQSVWQVAGSPALRIQPLFKLPSWILDRGNDKEYFSRLSPASAVALTSVFVRMRQPRYKERIVAVIHIRSAVSASEERWGQLVHAIFDLLPNNDNDLARLHPVRLRKALLRDTLLRDALCDAPLLDALRNALLLDALHDAPLGDEPLHDTLHDSPRDTLRRPFVVFICLLIVSCVIAGSQMNSAFVVLAVLSVLVLVLDMLGALLPLLRDTLRRPFVLPACALIGSVIVGIFFSDTFSLLVLAVSAVSLVIGMLVALRPLHDTLRRPLVFFTYVLMAVGAIVGSFFGDIVSPVFLAVSVLGLVGMLGGLRHPLIFFACAVIVGGGVASAFFLGPISFVIVLGPGLIGFSVCMPGALRFPFTLIGAVLIGAIPFTSTFSLTFGVIGTVIAVVVVVGMLDALLPHLRGALLCDEALLRDRDALRNTLRNTLRDDPVFARFDTPFFEALVYVYALFRETLKDDFLEESLRDALFRDPPLLFSLRLFDALRPRLFNFRPRLGDTRFDGMMVQGRIRRAYLEPEEPKHLINLLQKNQPREEESIWLLNTLSWLHYDGLVLMKHHVSKICLAILLHQAPKWNEKAPPNIILIESVVTLVAISCSSNEAYQREILTNSHQHPWLLLNLRNPELIRGTIEKINRSCHNELLSLLFLVLYALFLRRSKTLATSYLAIITAKCDFRFCASALTAIAPALGDDGFSAIGGLLLAPQTQFLTPADDGFMSDIPLFPLSHQGLFDNYDLQLRGSQFPDSNILAILLLLSKNLDPHVEQQLQGTDPKLRNPWLRLVAKVIARLGIPDESGMDFMPFDDHRLHNMFAALSLLRYSEKKVTHRIARESLFLASFLPSREFVISSLALRHYLETVISYSNPPPPSCYLAGAVHALFSPILPNNHLPTGWKILHVFVDEFEKLSVEWRQAIAEAFFTVSRRPLLSEKRQNDMPVTELNEILTWEYFCREEQEPEFTDRAFSGLDWMAMAWSLHLSQHSGIVSAQTAAQPPESKEFVLRALCKLLEAAPYYSILPIIPQLREFVAWFDDSNLLDYQSTVFASIEGTEQECERCYEFQKFHCVWYL